MCGLIFGDCLAGFSCFYRAIYYITTDTTNISSCLLTAYHHHMPGMKLSAL